ncbi:hypothetical protein GEMRC1_003960 [Eukaryota sp. GEM-RC1]
MLSLLVNDSSLETIDISLLINGDKRSIYTDALTLGCAVRVCLNLVDYLTCFDRLVDCYLSNRVLFFAHCHQLRYIGKVLTPDSVRLIPVDSPKFHSSPEPLEVEDFSLLIDQPDELSIILDWQPLAFSEISESLEPLTLSKGGIRKVVTAAQIRNLYRILNLEKSRMLLLRSIVLQNQPLVDHLSIKRSKSVSNPSTSSDTFVTSSTRKERLLHVANVAPLFTSFLSIRLDLRRSLRTLFLRLSSSEEDLVLPHTPQPNEGIVSTLADTYCKNLNEEAVPMYYRYSIILQTMLGFDSAGGLWELMRKSSEGNTELLKEKEGVLGLNNPFIMPSLFEILKISRDDTSANAARVLGEVQSSMFSVVSVAESLLVERFLDSQTSSVQSLLKNQDNLEILSSSMVQVMIQCLGDNSPSQIQKSVEKFNSLLSGRTLNLLINVISALMKRKSKADVISAIKRVINQYQSAINMRVNNQFHIALCPVMDDVFFRSSIKWILMTTILSLTGADKALTSAEFTALSLKSQEFSTIDEEIDHHCGIYHDYLCELKIDHLINTSELKSVDFDWRSHVSDGLNMDDVLSRVYLALKFQKFKNSLDSSTERITNQSSWAPSIPSFLEAFNSTIFNGNQRLTFEDFKELI